MLLPTTSENERDALRLPASRVVSFQCLEANLGLLNRAGDGVRQDAPPRDRLVRWSCGACGAIPLGIPPRRTHGTHTTRMEFALTTGLPVFISVLNGTLFMAETSLRHKAATYAIPDPVRRSARGSGGHFRSSSARARVTHHPSQLCITRHRLAVPHDHDPPCATRSPRKSIPVTVAMVFFANPPGLVCSSSAGKT